MKENKTIIIPSYEESGKVKRTAWNKLLSRSKRKFKNVITQSNSGVFNKIYRDES